MLELKLAKLPDRTSTKITITVTSELNQALRDYSEAYRESYGNDESVADLIPFMLATFIESDAGFKKARRDRQIPASPTAGSIITKGNAQRSAQD